MFLCGTILCLTPVVFVCLYIVFNYLIPGRKSVCVIVLGDVGRSPRMQYHSASFLTEGFTVDLVGYKGSPLHRELQENSNLTVHYLSDTPAVLKYFPRLVTYMCKVVWQIVTLGFTLLLLPKCGYTLIQNPPSIPTIFVCLCVCLLRRSCLVIDWHNYGYTILGMTLGPANVLVRFSKWYEKFFGRLASSGICVTKAMKTDLQTNWGIRATVVYDRPPDMFKETSIQHKHDLFFRLSKTYPVFCSRDGDSETSTVFTQRVDGGGCELVRDRPALLVSSTSWTEDEDFGVLLAALQGYEEAKHELVDSSLQDLPDLLCVITGKGPQKEYYREKIESKQWKHVHFCLPWLEPEDYPLLLGSADLGVCLHKSSSGLDLPMKVVDMFGCGLPVCAIDFNCISELVKDEENGLIFKDSDQLCQQIQSLLSGFPSKTSKLSTFRQNLAGFQSERWHECWKQTVLPLFIQTDTDKKDK